MLRDNFPNGAFVLVKIHETDKAPGPEGFTVEFYQKFCNLLGPLLLDVINKSFADGDLPTSMKTSMTRLIFKKHGEIKEAHNGFQQFQALKL